MGEEFALACLTKDTQFDERESLNLEIFEDQFIVIYYVICLTASAMIVCSR